jgi:hypothetical protein
MILRHGGPPQSLPEVVLFPFDDHALPFQRGLQLQLNGHRTPCGQTRVVLPIGGPEAPDGRSVAYYGTVCRVGDELWMWYLGQGDDPEWLQRVCLARSRDGRTWAKPELGLVPYHGSTRNNLVDLNQGSHLVQACVVLHEPDDPEPSRRFKMAFESRRYRNRLAVAFSPDGLTWTESPANPVGPQLEMAGGTRIAGFYHLCGQGGLHGPPARQMVTHVSSDFEHWTESFCIGLRREGNGRPGAGNDGRQVHLGAGLWNRGNVVLGFYGMWNGHPSNDRRLVSMDLGLAVSHDGLHFREPVPDFPIVSAAEDGWPELPARAPTTEYPALIQGQGFENLGEETLFWYAPWPEQRSDGVRVASWPRDRLGAYRGLRADGGHCISAPVNPEGRPVKVFLNVDGLGLHGRATVEVLDEGFAPLPGYGREDCVGNDRSGLRQPVQWRDREAVVSSRPVRVRVDLSGVRPEDVRLYAVYLEEAG